MSAARVSHGRILTRGELASFRRERRGSRIVFTNGCFDILHRGHVELLGKARSFGDVLVVGLNSDASVRRLKGAPRPFMSEADRAEILLAFSAVDFVTVFGEDTPLETITALEPDVLVKGGEYGPGEIVGEDFVKNHGGRVERIDMLPGQSTTGIVERIRKGS
jgi:D-beta-D-heptose 7-phosphate kinase/D-beta-D-heptose 1-phosphate adenosyltransferase